MSEDRPRRTFKFDEMVQLFRTAIIIEPIIKDLVENGGTLKMIEEIFYIIVERQKGNPEYEEEWDE